MRNLLCVIGRHEWRVEYDNEGRPFEICGRQGCYHVRDSDSRSDGPSTGTDRVTAAALLTTHLRGRPYGGGVDMGAAAARDNSAPAQ
jgi:hypothetical protein